LFVVSRLGGACCCRTKKMLRTRSLVKVFSRSASAQYTPATVGRRLRVATVDQRTHGGRVALVVNTGARDDAEDSVGLTHCMQAAACLDGDINTAFLTTQMLANYGTTLEVNVDREHIKYEVACHPSIMGEIISTVLIPNVLSSTYPHWELGEVYKRMHIQKAMMDKNPVFCLTEALHKAAFKGGMSNPIVSPEHMIGQHNTEMLMNRYVRDFQLKNMVIVGSGVSQKALEEYAEEGTQMLAHFNDELTDSAKSAPQFAGREVHVDRDSEISHVAIAYQGLNIGHQSNAALSVLQHILGTKGNVKRGSELERGVLNKYVDEYVDESLFSTSAANINYTDCGLFCVHIAADPNSIDTVARATAAELAKVASTGVDDEAVEAGRNRLLSSVAMSYENTDKLVRDTAIQALALNSKLDKGNLMFEIEKVTTDDVNAVAAQVLQHASAMSSFGNTAKMPALRDLQF